MLLLITFFCMELVASFIAVKKYWNFRVKDLGDQEGNNLKKIAIAFSTAVAINFGNPLLVIFLAIVLIEVIRNKHIAEAKLKHINNASPNP